MRKVLQPKTLVILVGFLCLTISKLHSQYAWTTYSGSWTHVQTVSEVKIDYSEPVICNFSDVTVQAEYIFLRISNLTNETKTISFRIDTYYKGSGCGTCNNEEYKFSFELPPNAIFQGDCGYNNPKQSELISSKGQLAVFKKFLSKKNYTEFEKFEISNITVQ